MRLTIALISICALLVSACAASDGGNADGGSAGSGGPSASDDEYTLPSDAKSIGPAGETVSGTLGFDDIEGGCAFIEAPDGTRYEVIYPDGWTLDQAAAQLRGPDGQVADAGSAVTVRGSVATDRSSICQIGPIFVATEVDIAPG